VVIVIKTKKKLSDIIHNDKLMLIFSFIAAIIIWLGVVINVSPETTRTIQNVKVTIDNTVPAQFGLEVFGDNEFYVDVTVKGKKYLISSLKAEEISVVAQTNNVDSAGVRTLLLKSEPSFGGSDYTVSAISQKSIDVFFDVPKTVQMVIEPELITDDFEIVEDGFKTGEINLSETAVNINGPSTEVNKIVKAVARLKLDKSLSANKSADVNVVLVDENSKSNFKYVTTDIEKVVLTIPVLRVKEVNTTVLFKNAPDEYMLNPLTYTISPSSDYFNISVDEYDKTTEFSVGTIDFKTISPTNYVFEFLSADLPVSDESYTESFVVKLEVSNLSQDYFTVSSNKVTVNNPDNLKYKISGLNKSVVVVGSEKALEKITEDDISVEIDISDINITAGQTTSVPANVTVKSSNCWVYGTYTVEVSL
jgi:YbbR domain-containing protein